MTDSEQRPPPGDLKAYTDAVQHCACYRAAMQCRLTPGDTLYIQAGKHEAVELAVAQACYYKASAPEAVMFSAATPLELFIHGRWWHIYKERCREALWTWGEIRESRRTGHQSELINSVMSDSPGTPILDLDVSKRAGADANSHDWAPGIGCTTMALTPGFLEAPQKRPQTPAPGAACTTRVYKRWLEIKHAPGSPFPPIRASKDEIEEYGRAFLADHPAGCPTVTGTAVVLAGHAVVTLDGSRNWLWGEALPPAVLRPLDLMTKAHQEKKQALKAWGQSVMGVTNKSIDQEPQHKLTMNDALSAAPSAMALDSKSIDDLVINGPPEANQKGSGPALIAAVTAAAGQLPAVSKAMVTRLVDRPVLAVALSLDVEKFCQLCVPEMPIKDYVKGLETVLSRWSYGVYKPVGHDVRVSNLVLSTGGQSVRYGVSLLKDEPWPGFSLGFLLEQLQLRIVNSERDAEDAIRLRDRKWLLSRKPIGKSCPTCGLSSGCMHPRG